MKKRVFFLFTFLIIVLACASSVIEAATCSCIDGYGVNKCGTACSSSCTCPTGYSCKTSTNRCCQPNCVDDSGITKCDGVSDGCVSTCDSCPTGTVCNTGTNRCCPVACSSAAECDDSNPCTADSCAFAGTCSAYCTHPNACTGSQICCGTGCLVPACSSSATCSDSNPCTADSCAFAGTCSAYCTHPNACIGNQICCSTGCVAPNCYSSANCDDGNTCTLDTCNNPGTCSASCSHTTGTSCSCVTQCIATPSDGCCPSGCTCMNDIDCPKNPKCSSNSDCNDGNACTTDYCNSPGSCYAVCSNIAITSCVSGDGCCPAGCTYSTPDTDCAETCKGRGTSCASKPCCGGLECCGNYCRDPTLDRYADGHSCSYDCRCKSNNCCADLSGTSLCFGTTNCIAEGQYAETACQCCSKTQDANGYCTPCANYKSCADKGFNCGSTGDGCGKTLDCGGTPGGSTCVNNVLKETNCNDKADNDKDGSVDCADLDCASVCKCDETDGGENDYTTFGTVTDRYGVVWSDSCNGNVVTEYYCGTGDNIGIAMSKTHTCTGDKCYGGACCHVSTTCGLINKVCGGPYNDNCGGTLMCGNNGACSSGLVCNTATGQCTSSGGKNDGESCGAPNECKSGFCVSGVCVACVNDDGCNSVYDEKCPGIRDNAYYACVKNSNNACYHWMTILSQCGSNFCYCSTTHKGCWYCDTSSGYTCDTSNHRCVLKEKRVFQWYHPDGSYCTTDSSPMYAEQGVEKYYSSNAPAQCCTSSGTLKVRFCSIADYACTAKTDTGYSCGTACSSYTTQTACTGAGCNWCADNSCRVDCAVCDKDGTCDPGEDCNCEDCDGKPDGCPTGQICSGKKCVDCDTDGGLNYLKKGTAGSTSTDSCPSWTQLTEYYCLSDGTVTSTSFNCQSLGDYQCTDGACVCSNVCSDGQKSCVTSTSRKECYYDSTAGCYKWSDPTNCPSGYTCSGSNGCVSTTVCSKSGTTCTDAAGSHTDSCTDSTLTTYSCNSQNTCEASTASCDASHAAGSCTTTPCHCDGSGHCVGCAGITQCSGFQVDNCCPSGCTCMEDVDCPLNPICSADADCHEKPNDNFCTQDWCASPGACYAGCGHTNLAGPQPGCSGTSNCAAGWQCDGKGNCYCPSSCNSDGNCQTSSGETCVNCPNDCNNKQADCGVNLCCSGSCKTPDCTAGSCNDGKPCTTDVCNSAGTCSAYCSSSNLWPPGQTPSGCTGTLGCSAGWRCDGNGNCYCPAVTCPDGTCSTGENCPADSGHCTKRVCYVSPQCTNGCVDSPVPKDQPDTGCSGTVGCAAGWLCNGVGGCYCPGTTCSETDPTNDIYTPGSCSGGNGNWPDACVAGGNPAVNQYYCSGNNCALVSGSPAVCPDNVCYTPSCSGGACGQTLVGTGSIDSGQCDASHAAGSCTTTPCHCDGAGNCVGTSSCSDTDPSNDVFVPGTCTDATGSHPDSCSLAGVLTQYSCSGNSCVIGSQADCPPGYTCNVDHCALSNVDGATFISQNVQNSMAKNSQQTVTVTMRNSGTTTWDNNYRLGSQNPQDNLNWGIGRVYLGTGETVAPGLSKTFSFTITARSTPGTVNFQWRMVHELVRWFGDYSTNVPISITDCDCTSAGLCCDGCHYKVGTVCSSEDICKGNQLCTDTACDANGNCNLPTGLCSSCAGKTIGDCGISTDRCISQPGNDVCDYTNDNSKCASCNDYCNPSFVCTSMVSSGCSYSYNDCISIASNPKPGQLPNDKSQCICHTYWSRNGC